jgi:hypothetical protein
MRNGEDTAKHGVSVRSAFVIESTKNVFAHCGDDFA